MQKEFTLFLKNRSKNDPSVGNTFFSTWDVMKPSLRTFFNVDRAGLKKLVL